MATFSGTCVTLVIILAECAFSANLTPDDGVAEDPNQSAAAPFTLGSVRTLNLAHPQEESVCEWNTRITQFLLDETKDRLELKFNLEKKINELYEQIEQMKSLFVKEEEELTGKPLKHFSLFIFHFFLLKVIDFLESLISNGTSPILYKLHTEMKIEYILSENFFTFIHAYTLQHILGL